MPEEISNIVGPMSLVALAMFVAAFQIFRWYLRRTAGARRNHRMTLGLVAAVALTGALLAYQVVSDSRIVVGADEHVIITRFGKPSRHPVQGQAQVWIAPFGIDQAHRFPKEVRQARIACVAPAIEMTADIVIDDPTVLFRTVRTVDHLPELICREAAGAYGAESDPPVQVDVDHLNGLISDLGVRVMIPE